jgi:hypothetical protein
MTKYIFDATTIEKQCYHLAVMAIASRQIREEFSPPENAMIHIFYAYEVQEIHQTLISVAVQLRMIDDILMQNSRTRQFAETVVGRLNVTGILSFRETCNKIIHAKEIEILLPAKPEIVLHGEKGSESWKAEFDILDFVRNAMNLVVSYDENWNIQ